MSAPIKVGAFLVSLALAFGASFGAARAIAPNGLVEHRGSSGHAVPVGSADLGHAHVHPEPRIEEVR